VKFAFPIWLLGSVLGLVVAGLLVLGAFGLMRAIKRFGEPGPVESLLTARSGSRRAIKGGLLVVAVAACFVALAQPQYGRGTRRIPATNLDVIIALDYSKSMYAKDVAPNRIERAKNEVARLISELSGARFGAVAFAGEPLSFPLTSDGGAIAQFFRQLTPHDMPVGGTAIARAMEAGRALLERDPRSKSHRRVMLLVTDGEDLEGDPVQSARAAKNDGISVFVVQIGGRTPEPVPDIDENGVNRGIRTDRDGRPLTTALTAEGEKQLAQIAEITGGNVVRSAQGSTGIDEVTRRLRTMMTEELSERVETVYADVYAYPLGLAMLLLLAEALVPEAPRRRQLRTGLGTLAAVPHAPKPSLRQRLGLSAIVLCALGLGGCKDTSAVDRAFTRNAPDVDRAVEALSGRDAGVAERLLTGYLGTGECEGGRIGNPPLLAERPEASFDLGLTLFQLAERFGARFGEDTGQVKDQALLGKRSEEVSCASSVLDRILGRHDLDLELRAHAHYLSGNLEFLRHNYKAAVAAYDRSLELVPGDDSETSDRVGRDAAHNRALSLRYEEENKKPPEPPDAGPPPEQPPDAGSSDKQDSDENKDGKDQQKKDEPEDKDDKQDQDQQDQKDPSQDQGQQNPDDQQANQDQQDPADRQQDESKGSGAQPEPPPAAQAPSPSLSQDDKVLDRLERAPTVQQHQARAQQGRMRPAVEDK
jgi:Ca-activated chloride channel family protein